MTLQEIKKIEDDIKEVMGKTKWSNIPFPTDRLEYEHFLRQLAWSQEVMTKEGKKILTKF